MQIFLIKNLDALDDPWGRTLVAVIAAESTKEAEKLLKDNVYGQNMLKDRCSWESIGTVHEKREEPAVLYLYYQGDPTQSV